MNTSTFSSIFAYLLLSFLIHSNKMYAQPLLTESFNYNSGTLLTGANWVQRAAGTPTVSVSAGNLSYNSTIANNFGNRVSLTPTGQDVYRSFTGVATTLYSSMIVDVSAAQATGDYFFVTGNTTSPLTYGARIYLRSNGTGYSFGVAKGANAPEYESAIRNFNTAYFIVLKYEVVTGATNDIVHLFVNPLPLNTEPGTADVVFSNTVGVDIGNTAGTNLSSINLYQGTAANAPTLQIDGINVGATWSSVATAQYDYGDAPNTYEQSKDNFFVPAQQAILTGLYIGDTPPQTEFSPNSVTAGNNNNGTNGDGIEEDGLVIPMDAIKQGLAYSLTVPVNNPAATTKYLYAWIDFNNNGRFELNEFTTAASINFTTVGYSFRTLTWSAAQTALIPDSIDKVYIRLRLTDRALIDFTGAIGGTILDERSIGNGAISASVASDNGIVPKGEVEDFQLDVVRLYDFGDVPITFEYDKDNNLAPALHAEGVDLTLGSLIDIESAPLSVTSPEENNDEGDNEYDLEDEDGIEEMPSVSRGVEYSIDININAPAGTKYLYAWLDLNNDGRFQVNELTTATLSFTTTGSFVRTLTWSAAQTNLIPINTKQIYLRVRLSATQLFDFTTVASGGAIIDERSISSGATSATNATLVSTIALGEVEDYQLPVDDYDFGDAPVTYENSVPARQIALPTRHIGTAVLFESTPNSVPSGADNNGINGDGEEEDGIVGTMPVVTKGASFSFSVPVTVNVASRILAWIDFNNDGKFQLSEAAYTAATGTSQQYQTAPIGTNNITFYFRGSQTHNLPDTVTNVYVRIRLTAATTSQSTDNATTTDIDERSIGDGHSSGAYNIPYIGEIEDYRFPVVKELDYGDAPISYEENRDNNSRPARNYTNEELYLGQAYILETGPSSVTTGNNNNTPNGEGMEEDGISNEQLFVRLGGVGNTNIYSVEVNNTTGAAATLHGWIDFNNNGRFESAEYAFVNVPNNTSGIVSLPFTVTQANNIPASVTHLYMRLRLIQANAEIAIADFTSGTNNAYVDERAIGDGLASGEYTSVSIGEVEDYQLTVIRDFGDVPLSYENGSPAFQSNTIIPELYIGDSVDYELLAASVNDGDDNNGSNGDGEDEDGFQIQETIVVGAPFSVTIPINSTLTGTKYLYAWIDFNGDGIFNGNEIQTLSFTGTGSLPQTLTWTGVQTGTTTAAVIAAGKTYIRVRLSAVVHNNGNSGNTALIDTRSYGPGNASGEIEDYQFIVSNLYDYGDVPLDYEMNANTVPASVPARQAPSSILRLGNTVDIESAANSVTLGDDNNGTNGDGTDEDGIVNLSPIYVGVPYRTQVSVMNNTGATRILHGWIDFNNNGRFEASEYTSLNVTSSANQQTVTLSWAAQSFTPPANNKLYMRLRVSQGTLADRTVGVNPALIDERSIGDGLSTGDYGVLQQGEIEDYQITVISDYDYGDTDSTSYELSRNDVYSPARQAISQGLYLGQLYPDAEASKQTSSEANGDNDNNLNDEDGAIPGPITAGGGYTLNVTYTNNSGAARTLYGWIDFNNNGRFEAVEVATVSLPNNNNNSIATLTWSLAQSNVIPNTANQLYMRLRVSEATLSDFTTGAPGLFVDERALADGHNSGEYQATPIIGNGEIEDYAIIVTTDLDYGDLPISYEQPSTLLPARQISSAALQIGGTPDVESGPQSVGAGMDNNGTNGDGEDEDGIIPANHSVTVNSIFTLPVTVTNTTGATKVLFGWLDINNNGIYELGEVATVNVVNNTNNGTVNLSWTAAQTRNIQTEKVYLRLRIADLLANASGIFDNASTPYDERAIGDGLSSGAYGTAPTRGEIEDYQLTVIPVFDFGDAPITYEANNNNDIFPARHLTASTLYLGSTYDVEHNAANVSSGNDNNGTNGDGTEEDGITTLPLLYPGGSYSVSVNVFKSISGTGSIHGWIDMNGDGKFSANEYAVTTVTAATGTQSATLTWSAVPYTSASNNAYMRLRFTTNTLVDNAATTNIDERSIGDGLSTGIYGTPVNGEIEDYYIDVDSTGGVASAPNCDGLGAIDPIQAGFHATMVRPASGGFLVFGESAHGNGSSNLNTPALLVSGSNGFNFAGDAVMATLASRYISTHQYAMLTTAGFYMWGVNNTMVASAVTGGTTMKQINLPPGITPGRVKMIDAGSGNLSVGSIVLLTTAGEVWVRTNNNANNTSNTSNAIQGDGNLLSNNGSTDWHHVQTAQDVPLTGMLDVRTAGAGAIATDGNNFYTWGVSVYLGDGSAATTQHYAQQMTLPTGFVAPARQVDLSHNNSPSYYILDDDGVVHVLGNNADGQLGLGHTTAQTTWQEITTIKEQPNAAGVQADVSRPIGPVTKISANNHDAMLPHFIAITAEKIAYHTGSNGGNMSGTVSANDRYTLTAMTAGNGARMLEGKMVFAEAGGHISVLAKEGNDRYGYVGHTISGSDGCGGCTGSPTEYEFNKTPSTGPLCGIEAFDFGDLDDRYNLGAKARHQIRHGQSNNPLKLGSIAADSDEEPQITGHLNDNEADGDDTDGTGDDEDAFSGNLPVKTAGMPYTINVPLTNNTGAVAYLYGFVDWNGDGVLSESETQIQMVNSSASQQTIALTWPDPGLSAANCDSLNNIKRSFLRLRLTTDMLVDNIGTNEDDRSHLAASDGEVEDYYVDWEPPVVSLDYGNLPSENDSIVWPIASAQLTSLNLSATRVWLGDDNDYPDTTCISNESKNGGLQILFTGNPVLGSGTAIDPWELTVNSTSNTNFEFSVTVNGNGAPNTPVYWAIWMDANNNGNFTDTNDIFVTDITNHGSPVTVQVPFSVALNGTNTGATHAALRIVATAINTTFTQLQNGAVSVQNGEVEDYFIVYNDVPLPIKLSNFTATKIESTVKLNWTTASEQNNKGFEIQRSTDSKEWIDLGFVKSLAENGFSMFNLAYEYTDLNPQVGSNYYRLKQLDYDGKIEYSVIRMVAFEGQNKGVVFYPNPTEGTLNISGLTGNNQIRVIDNIGRIIMTEQPKQSQNEYQLDLSALPEGLYYISIINEKGELVTEKVQKM